MVAVTVNVARVTVIAMVIVIVLLFCIVSHTQWQSCEWCGWFANSAPRWTYEQVSINKSRCFLWISLKKTVLSFRCVPCSETLFPCCFLNFFFYSINERLLKMEHQNNIHTRWLPSDAQYQSSLITTEAVKAKQTLDMMLVSGRRRWFLLSLKKKYTGIFYLFRSMGEKYVLEKNTHVFLTSSCSTSNQWNFFAHHYCQI